MRSCWMILTALCGALLTAPATAEAELGFAGIGPTISYVSPEDIDGTVGFGLLADFGTFMPQLGLEATSDFWSKSEGSGSEEVKFQDISFGGRLMYHFPVEGSKFDPAIGAGVALHFLRTEIPEFDVLGVTFGGTETETRIGFDLAGKMGYGVTDNLDLVVQTGYRVVEDFGQFVIGAGIVFGIGGGGN